MTDYTSMVTGGRHKYPGRSVAARRRVRIGRFARFTQGTFLPAASISSNPTFKLRRRTSRYVSIGDQYTDEVVDASENSGPQILTYLPTQIKGPLGNAVRTKMRFCHNTSFYNTSLLPHDVAAIFDMSSIYQPVDDPHDAMGYDQLADFFSKFTVVGSKMLVTFVGRGPPLGNPQQFTQVGVRMQRNAAPALIAPTNTSFNHNVERGHGSYTVVSTQEGGKSVKSLVLEYDPMSYYHISMDGLLGDDQYSGTLFAGAGNRPNQIACARVWVHNFGPTVLGQNWHYYANVVIEYDVVLRDPKPLLPS